MRLLPDDEEMGLTPYGWLIYVFIYLVPLFFLDDASPGYLALSGVAFVVFLVLYFRGFWVRGRSLLAIAVSIAVIGMLFLPTNPGASVFFVYAGAFFGQGFRRSFVYKSLALLVAALIAEALVFGVRPEGFLPAVVFSVLVGLINLHFAERGRAHSRLRLAQEEVERLAKLDERERIARDLHDLLGHTLSVITLKSQLAARLVRQDPERAEREMKEVEAISRDSTNDIRRAVRGYRFQQLGTELAKARMVLEAAGIEMHLETTPYELRADFESVLALALREAVTNVVRHARARNCHLTLRLEQPASHKADSDSWRSKRQAKPQSRFVLEVEDDGGGVVDDEVGGGADGWGLAGMRERLEPIGGSVDLSPSERYSRGTLLRVTLDRVATLPQDETGGSTDARPRALS